MALTKKRSTPTSVAAPERGAGVPASQEAADIVRGRTRVVHESVQNLGGAMLTGEREDRERAMAAEAARASLEEPVMLTVGEAGFTEAHRLAVESRADAFRAERAKQEVMRIHNAHPMNFEVPSQ